MLPTGAWSAGAHACTASATPREPVSAAIANAGTAVGALCFLAGAVMLLPEAAQGD